MKRWIDYTVEYNKFANEVVVRLNEHSQEADQAWAKTKIVGEGRIKTRTFFGHISLEQLNIRISQIRFNLYRTYKQNLNADSLVERLCEEQSKGRQVVDDPRTTNLIGFFAKS
jgi:hypothetical protein